VADFGDGPTAVFGWMPDPGNGQEARISAVRLHVNMGGGTAFFTPLWTLNRDAWKSSVALVPMQGVPARVVVAYGIGVPPNSGTGNYGYCDPHDLSGGILAISSTGQIAWEHNYGGLEGNMRASPAVADMNGDRRLDVLITAGCFGKLHVYDAVTGEEAWNFQLGPRTIGTASLGDLDGDGALEVVVGSYDGNVWVLGAERRVYLPVTLR
jgi:outer membrane protein assembly factor BamB